MQQGDEHAIRAQIVEVLAELLLDDLELDDLVDAEMGEAE